MNIFACLKTLCLFNIVGEEMRASEKGETERQRERRGNVFGKLPKERQALLKANLTISHPFLKNAYRH